MERVRDHFKPASPSLSDESTLPICGLLPKIVCESVAGLFYHVFLVIPHVGHESTLPELPDNQSTSPQRVPIGWPVEIDGFGTACATSHRGMHGETHHPQS